jgi:hypothetical protein
MPLDPSVLMRNNHPTRDGNYLQPTLTHAVAAQMVLDTTFKPTITGNVYPQPLYVANGPSGKGAFYVVTESNNVHAVAEADGSALWTKNMGTPAGASGAGCGNISPLGITGTPVIDENARTLYLDAAIGTGTTIQKHMIHALSIDDGTERAGFPFDTSTVSYKGTTFNPVLQNQRAALLLVNGVLYVPYAGHAGDCGQYRGWIIGIPVANPAGAKGFATGIRGGGIWGPGGPASDGTSVFITTGNTFGATTWQQGEGVIRLTAGPVFSGLTTDYFAPSNWQPLDGSDLDISGSGPVIVDVPGATPSQLIVALGKNGVAYLLDRTNLGGIGKGNGMTGEGAFSTQVAGGEIINAATTYTTASGRYLAFHVHNGASGVGCPGAGTGDLVALKFTATTPPTVSVAWCANNQGQGSPISTTTDGTSNVVVWSAGAEGSRRLHGFDGDTGAVVYAGGGAGDVMTNTTHRFNSPIAVNGRIIVAADNALYAFK